MVKPVNSTEESDQEMDTTPTRPAPTPIPIPSNPKSTTPGSLRKRKSAGEGVGNPTKVNKDTLGSDVATASGRKKKELKTTKEVFRWGGLEPQSLLIPWKVMEVLVKNPKGFALAIPLAPGYRFDGDEVRELEEKLEKKVGSREIKGSVIIWTPSEQETTMWSPSRPTEGILTTKTPSIIGGCGTFWPIPLQREGSYTSIVWKATFPEGFSSPWLDELSKALDEGMKKKFWTLSRRLEKSSREWVLKVAAEDWDDEDEDFGATFSLVLDKPGEANAKTKVEFERVEVCGFCIKTWPMKEVAHKASDCYRLSTINKYRGRFPPVTVKDGVITWVDREPTPDPEEAKTKVLDQISEKLDKVLKQQDLILSRLDKQQDKPKAEGSKPKAEGSKPKKAVKFNKAKEGQE